jgi:hypothetical protein
MHLESHYQCWREIPARSISKRSKSGLGSAKDSGQAAKVMTGTPQREPT